jgi:hypothetical protein
VETTQYTGSGSGFVVVSDRDTTLVATNYHVVEGNPYQISVWIGEEESVSATIRAYSSQKDLCILELQYPVSLPALKLKANGIKQGGAVYAVGYPAAADFLSDAEAHGSEKATITDGIVSAIRQMEVVEYGTPVSLLQINAAINAGNSGGPLFNAGGEVVGINTYAAYDSQGIFGAIAIDELLSFAADNNIQFSRSAPSWYLLLGIIGAALLAVLIITVLKREKRGGEKVRRSRKGEIPAVAFPDYLAAMGGRLTFSQAVSLLMPVAVRLRDIHDRGMANLKVAPENIVVQGNGAVLSDAAGSGGTAVYSGFTPAEIYRGKNAGNRSDIYSFCAVLAYAVTGRAPRNALERQEDPDAPMWETSSEAEQEPEYIAIINKGMAAAPQDRYANMQELIYELTPFNTQTVSQVSINAPAEESAVSAEPAETAENPPIKRSGKRKKRTLIAFGVVLTLLAVLAGGSALVVKMDYDHYAEGKDASSGFISDYLYNNYEFAPEKYVCARALFNDRKYELSAYVFDWIIFRDSEDYYFESKYRQAAQLAEANEFDEAIGIYTQLAKEVYKDSSDLINDTKYRLGAYELYTLGDFEAAYNIAEELKSLNYEKADELYHAAIYAWGAYLADEEDYMGAYEKFSEIPDYEDTNEILDTLTDLIYITAQNDYHAGNLIEAWNGFLLISPYQRSEDYLTLIYCQSLGQSIGSRILRMGISDSGYKLSFNSEVEALTDLFYFEDAAELLLANDDRACEFLLGTWRGSGYYFTMNEDNRITYNLPWINYGNFYIIEDGTCKFYSDSNYENIWRFTLLTPDSMDVYCYSNGYTYTLYRQ